MEGKNIIVKTQFLARANDVIISKIHANVGALAVVPSELNLALTSSDFPLFKVDQSKVNIEYLDRCLRYGNYPELLEDYSKGTTKRQRISRSDILDLTIYVPEKEEQEQIVSRVKTQEEIIKRTEQIIAAIRKGLVDESDLMEIGIKKA